MLSNKTVAKIAGIGYLAIFVSGIFANFFVLETLVTPEDATTTANNILTNDLTFRIGILSFIVMVIFDLILTWALYVLLQSVNKKVALLSAWFRLVNVAIFGMALYNLTNVLQILGDNEYLKNFTTEQLHAQAMIFLSSFNQSWLIGLIFFGVHLLLLGYLIIKSGYIPKVFGALLMIAGIGYLIDSHAQLLMHNYSDYETIFTLAVIVPGIVGELAFTFWLLFKGSKVPESEIQ